MAMTAIGRSISSLLGLLESNRSAICGSHGCDRYDRVFPDGSVGEYDFRALDLDDRIDSETRDGPGIWIERAALGIRICRFVLDEDGDSTRFRDANRRCAM